MKQSPYAIGIDLGGTRIKGVLVSSSGELLHQLYAPTGDDGTGRWKDAVKTTFSTLKEKAGDKDCLAGISAPGIPDAENQSISYMPGRLKGLEGFFWTTFLNHPCFVVNDAIAAMAAEARFGAARKVKHAVMLTLGTGVGGALLIDGRIHQGMFQKAGHLGHVTVDSESDPNKMNMPGSLEEAIGNCSIDRRSLGRYTSTQALIEDYRKSDPFASWLWLSSVRKLSIAIASLTNILSPEIVIIGGGITEAGKELFEPLDSFLGLYEWRAGEKAARVVKAEHGDLAGAIGAAGFALMQEEY